MLKEGSHSHMANLSKSNMTPTAVTTVMKPCQNVIVPLQCQANDKFA